MQAPAHTAPTQAALPGLATQQPAPSYAATLAALDEGTPLCLCAMGLVQHTAVRQAGSGAVLLEVVLRQQVPHHPHALPLLAVLHAPDMGSTASTLAWAQRHAAALPPGTSAIALGRGLEPGRHAGQQVLRLLHTTAVNPERALRHTTHTPATPPTEAPHAH